MRDPFGRAIDIISTTPERRATNIFTTIDHTIQANAEAVLRQTVAHWHAKSATAIVLDPRTGAVLAMAQAPGYDANNASQRPAFALQRNRAVTDTFEPGSTFKLVTIAGALSSGLVTPETKFVLPYSIQVADRVHPRRRAARDRDADRLADPLALVERRRGHDRREARRAAADGLDRPLRLRQADRHRLPRRERRDQVLPLDKWSGSTIGNVPIGQGIAVTPIQLASAYAAIANGGVWVQPHLVERVGGRTLHDFKHRRIVSPAVDAELKTMLTGVVDEHGATGNAARSPATRSPARPARRRSPARTATRPGKYVASFVGMVPVEEPAPASCS